MVERMALPARLLGGSIASTGQHGALLFETAEGGEVVLALSVDQYPLLLKAAALLQSQAIKLAGEAARPVPVEKWTTTGSSQAAVLTLEVFGGLKLQFQVTQGTKTSDAAVQH